MCCDVDKCVVMCHSEQEAVSYYGGWMSVL